MKDLFIKRFQYYKMLGDKSFEQLSDEQIFWQFNQESNSIAIIVKHVAGNMLSRWTNFLTEDGEKPWRNRDEEFVNTFQSKAEVLDYWEKGWKCLFEALSQINDQNLYSTIYIRNEGHSVIDAVFRQLAHYPYHIGQIVFIAKMMKNDDWKTLSIARNKSQDFNNEMKDKFTNGDIEIQNSSSVCFANSPDVRDDYKP
ncbi:DUF1572 domain-containing protein [Chryseobacterium indoltheticum]|uniref:Protein of uncharacterized function (DUF1572) n=1 Tax=Chryseobacterium indoltheticum TaxID=254 RepID=A0A381FA89_9FLAO|nr:DUF1572 domain-containing protein [Chryseobacterium indoltheticum]AZA73259.1 DUF1572 domain-containing protein [Chryseobacterium indoltheticum]SIR28027.1 Protein of unknown function [Chryseobacterium indoltheticum]SUX43002.1 Protein of uncharacterised function (DUF1572) [Chryseobacterium indoltheticum]